MFSTRIHIDDTSPLQGKLVKVISNLETLVYGDAIKKLVRDELMGKVFVAVDSQDDSPRWFSGNRHTYNLKYVGTDVFVMNTANSPVTQLTIAGNSLIEVEDKNGKYGVDLYE